MNGPQHDGSNESSEPAGASGRFRPEPVSAVGPMAASRVAPMGSAPEPRAPASPRVSPLPGPPHGAPDGIAWTSATGSPAALRTPDVTGSAKDRPRRAASRKSLAWARVLHVYTSMAALLLMLFFGVTGVTVNHPSWSFGLDPVTTSESGEFPFPVVGDDGVDYLAMTEFVRAEHNVKGGVDSYETSGSEGSIAFKNPGYSADLFFNTANNSYDLQTTQQGLVSVMNDLHKGRDSRAGWNWFIDLSGLFLVLISLTGLTMQFFLRRRRLSALFVALVGATATGLLIWWTLG